MNILDTLVSLVKEIFLAIADAFKLAWDTSHRTPTGYKNTFDHSGKFLSRKHTGFSVNGSAKGRIDADTSSKHCVIVGPSGSGKTSRIVLNSLYLFGEQDQSLVINDVSGEIFARTSGYFHARGFDIKVIDFANPDQSDGYNPLAFANDSSELSNVADLLIRNQMSGSSDQAFWNESSKSLLYMLCCILKTLPEQYQNLHNARYLLNQLGTNKSPLLDHLFSEADETLYQQYKSTLETDKRLLMNIVSTCRASLQILNDQNVARVTSRNTVSFSDLRKQKTVLYLKVPTLAALRLSAITSVLIEQCFAVLMEKIPAPGDLPIYFMLDELSSMVLPNFESVTANSRKYGISIMYALQHPDQLRTKYGPYQSQSIFQNTHTKIWLPGQEHDVAESISNALGLVDFIDPDNGHKRTMPVMTARAIQKLPPHQALVSVGNFTFKTKLHPYYKNKKMWSYSQLPAMIVRKPHAVTQLPLINKDALSDLRLTESEI